MFANITAVLSGALSFVSIVRAVLADLIVLADDVHNSLPAGTPTEQAVAHVESVLRAALGIAKDLPVSVDQVVPVLMGIVTSHLVAKVAPAPAEAAPVAVARVTGNEMMMPVPAVANQLVNQA